MKLSKHFVRDEFEISDLAVRRGIDNRIPDIKLANLECLVKDLLQPLRDSLGQPVMVASGYRCARLNREIAGSRNSAHTLALAADVWVANLSTFDLTEHVAKSELPFDCVVNEFGCWTHIQAPLPGHAPRRNVMTAHKLANNHTRVSDGNRLVDESRRLV